MAKVLVLGGCCDGLAMAVLTYLVPTDNAEARRVGHVRIVDKHLVLPQADAYAVYMDPVSKQALKQPDVEYMQLNLLLEDSRRRAFTPPPAHGPSYDYVFDFSGEPSFEATGQVYAERTTKLLPLLGKIAVEKGVKAYVRVMPTNYKGEKRPLKDGEGSPVGVKGKWAHEGIRALAAVPGLNLVVARPALLWGCYTLSGYTPRLLISKTYKYLGEPVHFLWSADLKLNTVHVHDFASALFTLARWSVDASPPDRAALAVPISTTLADSDRKLLPSDWPAKGQVIKACCFNIVDDGETTQGNMADLTAKVLDVEVGYHGKLINQFAKLNIGDVVEDINEKHLSTWAEMLARSNPPISDVPISPLIPADALSKHHVSLEPGALRSVVGWTPEYPSMDEAGVKHMLDVFRAEGFWPNPPPRGK